jgi:heme/copper-type cytochrome/quinol oxidase subunit 2
MSSPAAPMTNEPTPPRARRSRIAIALGTVLPILLLYVLSLVAVHLLAKSAPPLPAVDLSKVEAEDSVVQVRLEKLDTVANRLTVNVLVYPKDSLYDKNFGVLTTDAAVRIYPQNDLGDLQYPKGKSPAQVSTMIEASGDPGNWPFDSYKTEVIAADVFTGTGASREKVPARVEVTGKLDGWDATVTRVHDPDDAADIQDDVIITLQRSKGPLIFDVGICLVLVALPVLGLWVAVPMALGKTTFLPPFITWYAAMLFAIVPLRNVFPGSPPPGSWIDQALVLWVLIALVVAMTLFIFAWSRQRDRKKQT